MAHRTMKCTRSDEYLWRLCHWRYLPMPAYLKDFRCNTVNCTVAGRCAITFWGNGREILSDFIGWWRRVGRIDPKAKEHWGYISGPGAVWGNLELITPEGWAALPEDERSQLKQWLDTLPGMIFYD